jgi:predicted lactoylglutathione lyase
MRFGGRSGDFHFSVSSRGAVDEVLANAVSAGGGVVREATATPYGYFGYFSDPDGYLWNVATSN